MAWVKGAEPKKRVKEVPPPEPAVPTPVVARMIDPRIFDPAHSRRAAMQADVSIPLLTQMARGYTRDRGFDADGRPNSEISAIITTAAARLGVNLSQATGTQTWRGGGGEGGTGETVRDVRSAWNGWNLAELAVLNRYRRTAL